MSRVKRDIVVNFPSLEEVTDEDQSLILSMRKEILNHLKILS